MSVSMQELDSSLVLSFLSSIKPREVSALIIQYGSAQAVVVAIKNQEIKISEQELSSAFFQSEKERKLIEKEKIQVYLIQESGYPTLLKQIGSPPPLLYVKGQILDGSKPAIAMVGSRQCTYYGEKVARMLASGLAKASIVTVSGLARGVDSAVHEATLIEKGETWAVLGHGLNWIYPPSNKKMAEKIQEKGALISEFSMQTKPFPGNFPRRNRIIAGLTLGTIVVEGRDNSGSLITARIAAQEGREVMAVPGPVTSELSVASHRLIQSGAMLINSIEDIFSVFPQLPAAQSKMVQRIQALENKILPPHLLPLWNQLSDIPLQKEILFQKLKIEANLLTMYLLEMEMSGWIKSLPGGDIVRA